jgi:hypothetical protein
VQHLGDGVIDLSERPCLVDHPGPAGRVEGEDLGQVGAGADDRTDDRRAVQYGVEHRDAQRPGGGQRDEDEPSAAAQPGVGGGEGLVVDGQADGDIGASVPAKYLRRVLGADVDDDVRAELDGPQGQTSPNAGAFGPGLLTLSSGGQGR